MTVWQNLVSQPGAIIADGAMGTMLQQAGLKPGELPTLWNLQQADRVRAVHGAYLAAGAQILLTNTFSGNRFCLAKHGLASSVEEVNIAGAQILRSAIEAQNKQGRALVAGDIGPSGELLAPLGKLSFDQAVEGFAEQARALIEGGADVIWIETMADLEEVRAAMEGARKTYADIPIIATLTFDTRGRTMMGVKPEAAAGALSEWGISAFGGNCGNGPDEMLAVIEKMHAAFPEAILVAKSNAGAPEFVNGATVYRAASGTMAEAALKLRAAGSRIIGGCCGTTPAHIEAMAKALQQ